MNTALSAILLTIAEPIQVLITLALAPVFGVLSARSIAKDYGVYPYVELDEAESYYKWALDFYGPDHRQTAIGKAKVDAIQAKYKDLFLKDALDAQR